MLTKHQIPAAVGAIDCNAKSFVVNSQQDADALSACAAPLVSLNASLTIGTDAAGAIGFKNVDLVLNGSITAQDSPRLTSLTFTWDRSNLGLIGDLGKFTLRNLTRLTSLSAPDLVYTRGILLQDLPSLETVDFSSLEAVWSEFVLLGLPRLRSFVTTAWSHGIFLISGSTTLKDIALENVDKFVTSTYRGDISIGGISNVTVLTYYSMNASDVSIEGDGNLTLNFDCTECSMYSKRLVKAGSLTVSGLAAMGTIGSPWASYKGFDIDIGSFTATRNSFTLLPLPFSNLRVLHIVDNPNLSKLWYDLDFRDYSWEEIVIRGNPKLRLNSSKFGEDGTKWVWPSGNMSTMVFDGPFDNAFL